MPEYTVEMKGHFWGEITVEAEDEQSAMEKASDQGVELSDIAEIVDSTAVSAKYFQG